jgi:predicted nucleic acid-binding protein
VLVDTCIWASFFTKPSSDEKRAVDRLIDRDRVATIGPIVTEVVRGFRRDDQARWVSSRLKMAHFLAIDWDDWCNAAHLGRELAATGHVIPITDLVVATIALRVGAAVYTVDPHFDVIPGLKRYWPN